TAMREAVAGFRPKREPRGKPALPPAAVEALEGGGLGTPFDSRRAGGVSPLFRIINRGLTPPARQELIECLARRFQFIQQLRDRRRIVHLGSLEPRTRQHAEESVVILRSDRIELVIVAARTGERQP